MEKFKVEVKSSVEKDLSRIDSQFITKIIHTIKKLTIHPLSIDSKKLKGSKTSYRVKSGDYRILYRIDKSSRTITIFHVKH